MAWFRRSAHPEEDLSAYVDGELGERARRALETHLASCEACSTLLRELQDAKSLLSELPRLAPRRSFTLGPEFAAARQPAPRKRMSLTFAPVVALTVLVALLFVDAVDFSGGGSSDSGSFSTAASRQAEPGAGGLALESGKAPEAAPNASAGTAGGTAADSAAPAQDGESGAPSAGALTAPSPEEPAENAAPLTIRPAGDDESATSAEPPEAESGASQAQGPEGTSGGLSTLRILEIAATIALAASLLAVFLPRFTERRER